MVKVRGVDGEWREGGREEGREGEGKKTSDSTAI